MISLQQIYLLTIILSLTSLLLKNMTEKVDPFKVLNEIQEMIDDSDEDTANVISNIFNFMYNNAPYSIYVLILFLITTPILNLWFAYRNVKSILNQEK